MSTDDLFPAIEPFEIGHLAVDSRHSIYWEQSGNPDGKTVVFLHGGPGAGATPQHRRFFDPGAYRIVIFDQRGAGRSTPLGELTDNTTDHLIADMETLRQHLNIERWMLFGGSWGSSLALAYAEMYPDRCTGLVLRGIFLCRHQEIEWFLTGMGHFYPEAQREFVEYLPQDERDELLSNYYHRLTDIDPKVHMPAALAWSRYEGSCSTLLPSADVVAALTEPNAALGLARIEAHYFTHNLFIEEGALLAQAGKLAGIPGVIVQGRYDVVCPIISATELADVWPLADLQIVPDAGHSAMEPGIRKALVLATEQMKTQI